jgi:hypothetical protein
MCEAYGLTKDPTLRKPAQRAVDYLVGAQHAAGGWRYTPGQSGDTSVTGWVIQALRAGKLAGLRVPDATFRRAVAFLDSVRDPTNEGYGYVAPGSSSTLSAVGLLCRQYLQGWGPGEVRLVNGIKNNLEPTGPPAAANRPVNMYYYFYATQVLHNLGGRRWQAWNNRMRGALVRTQDRGGNAGLRGSWNPAGDPHAAAGGRLMYTSLSLLTLEVYYRYLPLHAAQRASGDKGRPDGNR